MALFNGYRILRHFGYRSPLRMRPFATSESSANNESDAKWIISSLLVFSPILYYLTAPPSYQQHQPPHSPPIVIVIGDKDEGQKAIKVFKQYGGSLVLKHFLPGQVSAIDTNEKTVRLTDQANFSFSKLLLIPPGDKKPSLAVSSLPSYLQDALTLADNANPDLSLVDGVSGLELDELRSASVGAPVLMVNKHMEAERDVYCAGPRVSYFDQNLGRCLIADPGHAEEAIDVAVHNVVASAGLALAKALAYVPRIHIATDGIVADAVGAVDPAAKTKAVWRGPLNDGDGVYKRGVVFYLRANRIVGILLWNLPGRVSIAHSIIADASYSAEDVPSLTKQFSLFTDDEQQ